VDRVILQQAVDTATSIVTMYCENVDKLPDSVRKLFLEVIPILSKRFRKPDEDTKRHNARVFLAKLFFAPAMNPRSFNLTIQFTRREQKALEVVWQIVQAVGSGLDATETIGAALRPLADELHRRFSGICDGLAAFPGVDRRTLAAQSTVEVSRAFFVHAEKLRVAMPGIMSHVLEGLEKVRDQESVMNRDKRSQVRREAHKKQARSNSNQ
jgi:hypothetical protein